MTFVAGLYRWLGVTTPFDPQARFVTSYILPLPALAFWRGIIAIYTLVAIIIDFSLSGAREFSFFTSLSYWGVTAYFWASALHTASYWWAYRRWGHSQSDHASSYPAKKEDGGAIVALQAPLQPSSSYEASTPRTANENSNIVPPEKPQSWLSKNFPRPLQFLHFLLYSTICTYVSHTAGLYRVEHRKLSSRPEAHEPFASSIQPLLVTIIFWSVLKSGAFSTVRYTWQNLSVHAFNLTFTMIDIIFLGRGPMMAWSHCFFAVLMLAAYVGVAYITYADQHFYPYNFLNQGVHGTPLVAGYIVAIGVACVVSFMIGQFVIFAREWTAAKIQKSGTWGSAISIGIRDEALLPTEYGPGPDRQGGFRTVPEGRKSPTG